MRWLLICMYVFSISVSAESFHAELRACLESVPVTQHSRFNLADRCPAYYSSLYDLGFLQTLDPMPGKQFSAQHLQQMNVLIRQSGQTRTLDYSELDGLLAEILIEQEPDQSKTWWNSFLAWFKSLKPEQYEHEFQWLKQFLEAMSLSEQAVTFILYGLLGLLSILAVGLVLYECNIAGLFSRVVRKQQAKQTTYPLGKTHDATLLSEIKQLNPNAQLVALLSYVISYMTTQQELPGDTSLTNQEFTAYLQRHHSHQQKTFALLVHTVDPVLYGNQTASVESLSCCWEQAERIMRK